MASHWIRPDFEDISIGAECTAYAGILQASPGPTLGERAPQAVPAQPKNPRITHREERDGC
jgi:coenzyme PQQ precursor peptide PqqA